MPKNKVLCLKDKVKICEDSMKPGFDKENCMLEFEIKRSCLKKIMRDKEKLLIFENKYHFVIIYSIQSKIHGELHSLSFIRNAYKERFLWLVKYFENIRNTLVSFLKTKEQTSLKMVKNMVFPQDKCSL